MSLNLSPAALFILLALVVPFLWSSVVAALRNAMRAGRPLSDRQEKVALGLMVLPALLGLAVVLVPGLFPHVPSPMPVMMPPVEPEMMAAIAVGDVPAAAQGLAQPYWMLLVVAYGTGAVWGLFKLGRGYIRMRDVVRKATSQQPDVRLTSEPVSPFASPCGAVVLPESFTAQATDTETSLILAHERAHIRRRDPVWFLGIAALDALFWFNPFVRYQTNACRLSAELACDAAVLGQVPQMRKEYAATLIRILKHTAGHPPTCAPAVFSPRTKGDIRVRLGDIMQPRPKRLNRRATGALVGLGLALVPLGAWQIAHATEINFSVRPVEGRLTSHFGPRLHPVDGKQQTHWGTDIAAPMGTPIYAPASGKVRRVTLSDTGYGNLLELDHGEGVITRYAQLQSIEVDGKDQVSAGDLIARVGSSGRSTGPHLHIEVVVNGKRVDPVTILDLPAKREE